MLQQRGQFPKYQTIVGPKIPMICRFIYSIFAVLFSSYLFLKGWDDVSFHGSSQIPTPNLDSLANNGVILNSYYVSPICTPTRASFMTGKHPVNLGKSYSASFHHFYLVTEQLLYYYIESRKHSSKFLKMDKCRKNTNHTKCFQPRSQGPFPSLGGVSQGKENLSREKRKKKLYPLHPPQSYINSSRLSVDSIQIIRRSDFILMGE